MSVDKFGRFDQSVKGSHAELHDVASVSFVRNNFLPLSKANNHYDAQDRCIRNVSLPLMPDDVANMQYVRNYGLGRTADMHYTANNKFLRDVRDPVLSSDAANMAFVNKCALKRTFPDGNIDLEGKQVRNLGDPILPTDAVNMQYVTKNTPKVYDTHWMFSDKKLSNVQDPTYDGEAVNFRTLKRYVKKWVTKQEGQIQRLSSAMFDYIHRVTDKTPLLGINNKNYLNMDDILDKKLLEEEEEETVETSRRREKRI